MGILERLENEETAIDAIDDAIRLICRMRAIIVFLANANSTARLEGAELWSVNSEFQTEIDNVLKTA